VTERGELVLRRQGDRFEIISNGVFLMDTGDGTSERLLIDAALARCPAPQPRLLIGGLGVGFSLRQACRYEQIRAIDVVEIEPAIVHWHRQFLSGLTGAALSDPRVEVVVADITDWLTGATQYDAICLDTDNGPNWLVFAANEAVYSRGGLRTLRSRLAPGGVVAVWSAQPDPAFEARLAMEFAAVEVLETAKPRGGPDIVYLAHT
jgi:spermidine synthase